MWGSLHTPWFPLAACSNPFVPYSPALSGQTGEKGFLRDWEPLATCDGGLVAEQPLNLGSFPEQMGSKEIFFF